MYLEIALISLQTLLICGFILFLHRGMSREVHTGIKMLDQNIAEAISKVLEGDFDIPENINPIQQLFAQFIQNKMQNSAPDLELVRDASGKFT